MALPTFDKVQTIGICREISGGDPLMEERRGARRYKVPLPVVVKRLPLNATLREIQAMTRDVSTGGVYFTSNERFAVGIKLALSLTLPPEVTQGSALVIHAQARVLRLDECPVGDADRFGVAAIVDRFDVSRASVDFALYKAEQVTGANRSAAATG
jgi:PilZ domain